MGKTIPLWSIELHNAPTAIGKYFGGAANSDKLHRCTVALYVRRNQDDESALVAQSRHPVTAQVQQTSDHLRAAGGCQSRAERPGGLCQIVGADSLEKFDLRGFGK